MNQTLLIPTLISPIILPIFYFYSFYPPQPIPAFFYETIYLYIAATAIELLAEPYYLKTLQNWEKVTSQRVRVEGIAIIGKACSTLFVVKYFGVEFALIAFGFGQLGYSIFLFLGFYYLSSSEIDWSFKKVQGKRFDEEVAGLSWEITKQSLVKQFLTESDKIIVGRFSKVEDQGGYAIALNYGE